MGRKLTLDKFKEKSHKIHGCKYDYTKTKYTNCNTKVIIICETHGEFLQKPGHHLRGQGCPKCRNEQSRVAKIKPLQKVIDEFNNIHNHKYDYSEFKYTNTYTPSKIICPTHGVFLQRARDHIKGNGCPKCSNEKQTSNIDTFVGVAEKIHNNKYDYTKSFYVNGQTKISIECPEHGVFEQLPNNHLQQHGCPKCSYEYRGRKQCKTQTEFIEECNTLHNNKYDYTKIHYVTGKSKIRISCPIHGTFYQKAENHLYSKQGCPTCGYVGCYTEHLFNIKPELKRKPAILYIVNFQSAGTNFYKIGVTTKTIKERFHSNKEYSVTTVQSWNMSLYEAFQIEQKILKEFNSMKYTPPSKIGGDTECFMLVTEELNLMLLRVDSCQNS